MIVVPLTSNVTLAALPGNVLLPRLVTGLDRDSVANVSQITTVSREYAQYPTVTLPSANLAEVAAGVRLVLGL